MLLRQFPNRQKFCQLFEQYTVVPLCREILADTETPVSVLQKLYLEKEPAFLFESVEGGERWGRYSFLSTSVRTHIRVYKKNIEIQKNNKIEKIEHRGKPFDIIRERMKSYRPAVMADLPRFWGGLVGYLTYETISFFEAIKNKWPEEKPLAHFIIPDEILIFDNIRNTLMIVAIAYKNDDSNAENAYDAASAKIDALFNRITNSKMVNKPIKEKGSFTLTPLCSEHDFRQRVEKIVSHIYAGDVIQTVISQPFVCDAPEDILLLYRTQRYINPSPYLFFLHLGDMALVGSSPETMVRLENGIATLRPIAGTRPRGKSEQEDRDLADELLQDEKERAEHLMLVDLGRNDLGRVAETGTVQVTDLMVVERYSHVMHLVSNIKCDLQSNFDAWDLMAATFPAGTLSGAPKVRAMELISELEDNPRGPYGGAVGYISFNGNMDLAITIRTACIVGDKLTVIAGAGIVADSDPEKERVETINKAMAIQKALHLIERQSGNH